jgi:thiamine pyrophosphate-dependent acetolactate synthase large subunit-like protein
VPAAAAVSALADALARSARPVFIAGHGARTGGARHQLERLADACGALLATSAAAKACSAAVRGIWMSAADSPPRWQLS